MSSRDNRRSRRGYYDADLFGNGYLITNNEVYNYYFNMLMDAASMPFDWDGIPEEWDRWFIEQSFTEYGTVAAYEALDTLICTPWVQTSGFDMYGIPLRIRGFTAWKPTIPVEGDFVIGYDRQGSRRNGGIGGSTTMSRIRFHAKRLYEMEQTYRANLRHQRKPFIVAVSSDGKTIKSTRAVFTSIESFDPVIEVPADSAITDSISTVKTDVPYIGGQLLADRVTLLNDALNELGISGESSKKERMIASELDLNREADNMQLRSRLVARQEFVEAVNKRFGTDISVEASVKPIDVGSVVTNVPGEFE